MTIDKRCEDLSPTSEEPSTRRTDGIIAYLQRLARQDPTNTLYATAATELIAAYYPSKPGVIQ